LSATVRDARPLDAAGIAAVHVEAWRAAYDGLLPAAMLAALSVSDGAARWSRALAAGEVVVVAEAEDGIVGFASVGASRDADAAGAGELNAIYLHPDRWSRGDGHLLHEAAVARLCDLGYDAASLWVLDGNERAIGFYERHGWQPDGTTKLDQRGDVALRERRFRRPL
jgi:GNAT superfamily N-acetyltransferase